MISHQLQIEGIHIFNHDGYCFWGMNWHVAVYPVAWYMPMILHALEESFNSPHVVSLTRCDPAVRCSNAHLWCMHRADAVQRQEKTKEDDGTVMNESGFI